MGYYFDDEVNDEERMQRSRKYIGERIRSLRKIKQEKQITVAETCGISKTQISRIEQGKGDLNACMIPVLADRYNVFAETFFNKGGYLPDELFDRFLHELDLDEHKEKILKEVLHLADKAIERGNGRAMAEMMYVTLKLCAEEDHPLEYIGRETQRVKEGDVEAEILGIISESDK